MVETGGSSSVPSTVAIAVVLAFVNGLFAVGLGIYALTQSRTGWAAYSILWGILWFAITVGLANLKPEARVLAIGIVVVGWLIQAIVFRYFEVISTQVVTAVLLVLPPSNRAFADATQSGVPSPPPP